MNAKQIEDFAAEILKECHWLDNCVPTAAIYIQTKQNIVGNLKEQFGVKQ